MSLQIFSLMLYSIDQVNKKKLVKNTEEDDEEVEEEEKEEEDTSFVLEGEVHLLVIFKLVCSFLCY